MESVAFKPWPTRDFKTQWQRFRWVALILFSLLCLTLLTSCSEVRQVVNPSGAQTTANNSQDNQQNKSLGTFSPVPGTRYLNAQITEAQDSSIRYSSDYKGSVIYNLVYFDPASARMTRLLPSNDFRVIATIYLPTSETTQPPQLVSWALYSIVKRDSNNDRTLNEKDERTLAMTDAGGQGYTELIENIKELYGHTMTDTNSLTVIYLKGGRLLTSKINLQKRQVESTQELPSLGSDVKFAA
jgi:hypothetical protein